MRDLASSSCLGNQPGSGAPGQLSNNDFAFHQAWQGACGRHATARTANTSYHSLPAYYSFTSITHPCAC